MIELDDAINWQQNTSHQTDDNYMRKQRKTSINMKEITLLKNKNPDPRKNGGMGDFM